MEAIKRYLVKVFFTILIVIHTITTSAQVEKLQAAFIFQFTRLIEWCPAGKEGKFTIVLLGESSIKIELANLQGRKVANQDIEFRNVSSVDEIGYCQILVVPQSKAGDLPVILSRIGSSCTLLVCEKSGSAAQGAGISFNTEGGKMQFEINKSYMTKHSLSVNEQLIKLAKATY